MWECRCDCGSIVQIRGTHLKDGFTRSCGCVKSHGERKISKRLADEKISFRREYTFPDCVSSKGNVLKFDFAIMENSNLLCLIEYQGEQHFKAPSRNPTFGQLQREETDKIKKEYCLTHGIPLYEIRFDEDIDLRIDHILDILHDNTVPSLDDESGKV